MKQQGNAEIAGKEDVNGALQNLQAREPDGIYSDPVRPYSTFPRPAASAWHYSDGFLFPHGWLVLYMQCRASSWQSSRCLEPVLHAATPAESKRCFVWIYVSCVFQSGLECWKASLYVIARGSTSHETKTDTKSMRGKTVRELEKFIYLGRYSFLLKKTT